jgi:Zn-finger nucleic acid-binding protein
MNPVNIICANCGKDQLVEPEVADNEDATCPDCKGYLHNVVELDDLTNWMANFVED